MRILWDFRLFSYGYANRGVGTYTLRVARSIIHLLSNEKIFIWAQKDHLPKEMLAWPVEWIPYTPCSWKKDLFRIPIIIGKYHIDLMHYWIVLGPIHSIGLGLFHRCAGMGVVYDLAVELWPDVPFASSKKNTWYWKTQKRLIRSFSAVFCISNATRQDLAQVITKGNFKTPVVYMPVTENISPDNTLRKPYFFTFGGASHKNLKRTIEAFSIAKIALMDLTLIVLGDVNRAEEIPDPLPQGVIFEDLSHYDEHRKNACGLICCSLHEGLGIPAIEAILWACPLLLSPIPCFKELWNDIACFAAPEDVSSITSGMKNLLLNQDLWQEKALQGRLFYSKMAKDAGRKIVSLYYEHQ
jgi:glycosyltransferase involved in cell wall biosynthesis